MLGGPGGEHPTRGQHDSHLTDLMDCCTGDRLARQPHVGGMCDGRSPLGGLEDVPSTRGLLDGRLKDSIERSTRWQVQMDGRSSEVARLTPGTWRTLVSPPESYLTVDGRPQQTVACWDDQTAR